MNILYTYIYIYVCVCAQSLSHVQLFVTPWTGTSSVRGILETRILEWVAVFSSRGSSQPRGQTHAPCVPCVATTGRQILYHKHYHIYDLYLYACMLSHFSHVRLTDIYAYIPGLGSCLGEGNSNPLQYSCLESSMDGGARWATVHWVTKCRHD